MNNLKHYLSTILLLLFISASLAAQEGKVSVTGGKITVKQAFEQIEAQSKYTIAYNLTTFDVKRKISLDIKNKPLKEVLNTILKESKFTYKVNGMHIIIIPETKQKK